ncbi:MAG: Si-specific NAD(P)(+) transhydrogenase [Gemmatimonadetes bacterium]|nr:Si-specific NAD(P)(+) transhydrogenase [Gemmatimonadota bacterium]
MSFDYDLLCLGSGPAGQRGAVQGAKLGRRVAIVERRTVVGGACLEVGTIPSKTLREAIVRLTGPVARTGRLRGPRPTAAQLVERVGEVVANEVDVITDQLERNGVEVLCGAAEFLDPHRLAITGAHGRREVTAERILVATGTEAAPLPGIHPDGEVVLTSDHVGTLPSLPRSLTVIGAGVIGIEYASMFASLGVAVTLVDRRARPLEFVDGEIVDELLHQMRRRHVSFRFGEAVERLEVTADRARRATLWLESGKKIVTDMALFSVGRIGATAHLGLDRAGVTVDDRGRVSVDGQFRTNVPHIYAAGDVIGYPSLAATSSEQGRLAACHALGAAAPAMAAHFPIGIYAVPEISMVGATEGTLTRAKVPYEVGVARYCEIARGQILGDDSGFFKMIFHRDDRRLLGVHIIGTQATELLHIGQAVIAHGGGLDYFLTNVFNYPTLAECYKVAALNAANKLAA